MISRRKGQGWYLPAKYLPAKYLPAKYLPAKYLPAKYLPAKYLRAKYLPAKYLPAKYLPAKYLRAQVFAKRFIAVNTLVADKGMGRGFDVVYAKTLICRRAAPERMIIDQSPFTIKASITKVALVHGAPKS